MDQRGQPYNGGGGQPQQQQPSSVSHPGHPPPPPVLASSFNQPLYHPANGVRALQHQPSQQHQPGQQQRLPQFGGSHPQQQQPFPSFGGASGSPQSALFSVMPHPDPRPSPQQQPSAGSLYSHPIPQSSLSGGQTAGISTNGPAGFQPPHLQQQPAGLHPYDRPPPPGYPSQQLHHQQQLMRQQQRLAQGQLPPPDRPESAVKLEDAAPGPIQPQPMAPASVHDHRPPSRPGSASSSHTTSPNGGGGHHVDQHHHDPSAGPSRVTGGGGAKTAKRAVQSCSECRRRKIRCDRVFPCTPCSQRGDASICREVEKHVPTSNGCASASDLLALTYRIASLEGLLQSRGVLGAGELDRLLGSKGKVGEGLREQWDAGFREGGSSARGSVPPWDTAGGGTTDGEGDAGGRRKTSKKRKLVKVGGQAGSSSKKSSRPQTAHRSDDDGDEKSSDESPEDGLDSETEDAAQTLEHLAFGRRRENPQPVSAMARSPNRPILPLPTPSSHHRQLLSSPTSYMHDLPRLATPHNTNNVLPSISSSPGGQISSSASAIPLFNHQSLVAMGQKTPASSIGGPVALAVGATSATTSPGTDDHLPSLAPKGKWDDMLRILAGGKDGIKGVFDVFFQRSDLFMEAFLSCLPGEAKERVLIDHYFAKVEWFHHCLHRPTFMRQCEEFWAIPQERRASVCSPSWVGLLQMLLCLSLHFMDSDTAAAAGFSKEDEVTLPSIWYSATRGALWQSDFLTNHSLENLQVIVLCGVYVINQDRADAQWGILGAGIKIAHMMGLNRLGPEQLVVPEGEQPKQWVGRWESLITRETARRVWWQLVFLDWSLASAYGYSCTIHPEQISCALPANVRDEDIVDGEPLKPQPKEVHTPMSYHLTRLRLCRTSYRVIVLMNTAPHPPYDMVLAIDAEFKKIGQELPEYFKITKDKPLEPPVDDTSDEDLVRHWEKVISNLSLQTRWMRLHRPFLSKGYTNRKYAYSTQQCVRAARESIAIVNDGVGTSHSATFFERWWIPVLYTFFASCVLCIDLLHTVRDAEWDTKLQEVYHGLKYLKNIEKYSSPARGSVKVIETLLLEATNRPAGASDKPIRKMSFDALSSSGSDQDSQAGGLQRAVRRLVHSNGTAVTSPLAASADTPSPAVAAGSSPAPAGPGPTNLLKQTPTGGSTSLRSPTEPADPNGNGIPRPTLQQMSQSLPAGLPGSRSSPGGSAISTMPPPQYLPGQQQQQPQQQLQQQQLQQARQQQRFQQPSPMPFGQNAYGGNATFGGWNDDFFGASNTGYGTFGGQPGAEVGIPPTDATFLDNDLMSQILSLPDLDWMLGPNGESSAF